jgi:hypothetical protein
MPLSGPAFLFDVRSRRFAMWFDPGMPAFRTISIGLIISHSRQYSFNSK